ncbi:MAG: aminoacetone oxidase family FAD-binding enzyme, partial [Victivallales bacterium]|nr:aminoacetone oxidase family FAD-binding enzyme [Victivallales bacterium]
EQLAERFGRQGRFTLPALNCLPPPALREFFERRGVPTVVTDGFHVFPESQRSQDVLDALLRNCERLNVKIISSRTISLLIINNGSVCGVSDADQDYLSDRILIATGGRGYPRLGGRGIGYNLAEQAGHSIVEPLPGMTGLKTVESWPHSCTGISFERCNATIDLPRYRKSICSGELLFTHNGVSGPAIIDLAGEVSALLKKHTNIPLVISMFPELERNDWIKLFSQWQRDHGKRSIRRLLTNHMPQKLTEIFCELAEIDSEQKAAEFNAAGREKLATLLSATPLRICGTDGWNKAMVTRGGVSLKNVDPHTLESRLVKGLFFAGEVLDLDGPCGGYNLQWAFASGCLAGISLARQ